ncbi:phosphatase PAP2 family protein [Candidatus Saccharibacteria bacterium]|nr:phosphatase PAP2 family protein [Candidatus Saccharibacteria bacterium]
MKKKIELLSIILPLILFAVIVTLVFIIKFKGFDIWAYDETVEGMSHTLTNIMIVITHLGDPLVLCLIGLALFTIPFTRKKFAIPVAAAIIVAGATDFVLKNIFARPRPDILRLITETDYSFPSGHAVTNMAMYAVLTILIFRYVKQNWLKYLLAAYCLIATVVIGYSRVYLGVHYWTDVIGGWCVGLAIALVIDWLWQKYSKHRENLLDHELKNSPSK